MERIGICYNSIYKGENKKMKKKKGNNKIVLWAIVALIIGVIIGSLTNLVVTGNARKILSYDIDSINYRDSRTEDRTKDVTIHCTCENGNTIIYYGIPEGPTNIIAATCEIACAGSAVNSIGAIA